MTHSTTAAEPSLVLGRQQLLVGLADVASLAKPGAPIYACSTVALRAHGHELWLSCTDASCWLKSRLPLDQSATLGLLVDARTLLAWTKLVSDSEVVIQPVDRRVELIAGDARLRLSTMPIEEFPDPPSVGDDALTIELDARLLGEALDSVLYACYRGNDNLRPSLSGVAFRTRGDRLELMAADGYRLAAARIQVSVPASVDVIVPRVAAERLLAIADRASMVTLRIGQSAIWARGDTAELASVLVDGQFPDVDRIIGVTPTTIVRVDRDALLERLRQVAVAVDDTKRIDLEVTEGQLVLNCDSELASARAVLDATVEGDPIALGINVGYVQDALRTITDPEIQIVIAGSKQPVRLLRGDGDDWRFAAVMPMVR